jgi:hypothetical protein
MRLDRCRAVSGFAVVDAVVAIVLLAVGILGLAATAAVVGSQLRASYRSSQIRVLGESEMERLLARGHDGLVAGESRQGALRAHWSVTDGEGLKQVILIVEHRSGGDVAADTFSTLVWGP